MRIQAGGRSILKVEVCMAGENLDYGDMDKIPVTEMR